MAKTEFEIPQSMRELAEKSVDQARDAYNQFMDASRKAQDMMRESSSAMTANALDIQKTALQFSETNMESSLRFAGRLAKAKDVNEVFEIQSEFARESMQNYAAQAREITKMMGEAAQEAKPKK